MRANLKWKLVSRLVGSFLLLLLAIGITSCEQPPTVTDNQAGITANINTLTSTDGPLSEVNTPASIAKLAPSLEKYHPQVQILSPKPDETLSDDRVTVKLKVTDLPLFKNSQLGLGNHLHVILDKQTYQGVYDLRQPLVFKNLAAGTHSLRVFASRPWHESFKNAGAFAQVKFHVLTKTAENNPDPQQPLLTFSRPAGTYSAEPIMLDYYLTNAPSHPVIEGSADRVPDWRVRVTLNDQRFILDRWTPVYLQGFKQGKNWVRLELVDDRGTPIQNVYNDTLGVVTYDPQIKDSLAQLIHGELPADLAQTLVDPNYVAIAPEPVPTPFNAPASLPTPISPDPIAIAPTVIQPSPNSLPAPISELDQLSSADVDTESTRNTEDRGRITANPAVAPNIESSRQPTTDPSHPTATLAPAGLNAPILPPVNAPIDPHSVVTPVPTAPPKITLTSPEIAIAPPPVTLEHSATDRKLPTVPVAPPEHREMPAPVTQTQLETQAENTWQTQAIEISKLVKAKIRVFTNAIPAKAQRFRHNLQIWYGKARELIFD